MWRYSSLLRWYHNYDHPLKCAKIRLDTEVSDTRLLDPGMLATIWEPTVADDICSRTARPSPQYDYPVVMASQHFDPTWGPGPDQWAYRMVQHITSLGLIYSYSAFITIISVKFYVNISNLKSRDDQPEQEGRHLGRLKFPYLTIYIPMSPFFAQFARRGKWIEFAT
ncbi:hypothetical protein F4777DRAFT_348956 [Nemania sp. FL0916]|nr:hypothetical protein F4777DRAFT_348956 [Nemania sp. FL0916]